MPNEQADRESAIVAAYMRGDPIPKIMEDFGITAVTLNWILHHSGKVPWRHRRRTGDDRVDAVLAGLNELVDHQARLIAELEETIERLRHRNGDRS